MKSHIIITILFLLLSDFGIGQNRFSIGASSNLEVTKLVINHSEPPSGLSEKGGFGFGFSTGIQGQYGLSESVFLRSGLVFQRIKYRYKIEGLRFATDISNGTTSSIQNDMILSSVGIPLDLGIRLKSKSENLDFIFGIGGFVNINLDTKNKGKILHAQMDNENLTQVDNQIDNPILSLGLFGGIEKSLRNKMIIGIEPNLRITPSEFELYLYESEASALEVGLTLRVRGK